MFSENFKMVSLAGLLVLGASAVAAKGNMDERFGQIDADNNGEITQEEIKAHAASRFSATDTDGDGFLSQDELVAHAEEKRVKRAERMIERMDKDGDGKLALTEMQGRRDPAKMFERLDKDGNGSLSKAEFEDGAKRGKRRGKRGDKQASE